ncbi:acyl-CoA synthetase [Mesorhizobium escarrei]|uniref:O-succinylbenzoate--CoA ligase n=1 Tax=Mesorhizobium escarrei TaxID=666018 RepID=A0ABM9EGK1_9HYPH|nr:long-chain fatty acid--CoA ligase [Mesorhizobium escarrei]CAH2408486.1 Putative O-succinylbenzoate--CoA ligase [Mesorhizobium escarrei]
MSTCHHDWIAHHAARRPEALAAVNLENGRRLTYRMFDRRIATLARHLQEACAVSPGVRVALLAHNSTDTFELQFACFRLGAIFVPLNWRLALPELDAIIGDCTPAVLIYDPEFADVADELTRRHGIVHRLLRGPEKSPYERAIAAAQPLAAPHRLTHDAVCTILYTSGTTGVAKGSIATHGMNFWNAMNCIGVAVLSPQTVLLCVLPLFHAAGLNIYANPTFYAGGTVAVTRRFDAGEALRQLADPMLGVTHLHGVPAHYQAMAAHADFAAADLSNVVGAFVGAAPVPVPLLDTWRRKGVVLRQNYGMTETGPLILNLEAADAARKVDSAGKPVMHVEVRVVADAARDAALGEVGELWVRGPAVTPGYWNQPEATRAAFAEGGWLRTGDAVRVDEEGFVTIVDRWKDMYVSGGENVYPAEVENVLYSHPEVAEAAVIGVPDSRWGEVGCAIVVRKNGAAVTEAELLAHCATALARYKVPRTAMFVEALPRSAVGKVHKPTLRHQFRSAVSGDSQT